MVGDVAIDVGTYSVKSLSVTRKGHLYHVDDAKEEVLDLSAVKNENEALSNALVQLFSKDKKLTKVSPQITVPLSEVIIREVELEGSASDSDYQIEKNIEVKLLDALPFTIDQIYFDYVPKSIDKEKSVYLVAAVRRDYVDEKTQTINNFLDKKKKASVNTVDVDAYAYGRLINQIYLTELVKGEVIALVDIGKKDSRFYFYGEEGYLFSRVQQIGSQQITENMMDVFEWSESEAESKKLSGNFSQDIIDGAITPFIHAFSEQLLLVIDFYDASKKNETKVSKIVLCGGGACLDGLAESLDHELEFSVENLDLVPVIRSSAKGVDINKQFSAKYALAAAILSEGKTK